MSLPHFEIEVTHIGPEMTTFRVWSWYVEDGAHTNCGMLTMYHDEYIAFIHRFFNDDPIEVKIKDLQHTYEMIKSQEVGVTRHYYPLEKKVTDESING